jgi:hypothetical protein
LKNGIQVKKSATPPAISIAADSGIGDLVLDNPLTEYHSRFNNNQNSFIPERVQEVLVHSRTSSRLNIPSHRSSDRLDHEFGGSL